MSECCDPTPNPCPPNTTVCTQEYSAYCIRYNKGEDLDCIGITVADNARLSTILKALDDNICAMSGSGDYSGYNVYCLAPVTTQQSWVEKISDYVCDLNTTVGANYTTLVNMINNVTDPDIGASTNLVITGTCVEIAGLAYTNGVTTLNEHIINMRDAICDTYNLLQTRTNLTSIIWPSCFSSTDYVNVAIQNIVDLVCVQQSQIAAIVSNTNPCGKMDKYNFSTDFTDVTTSTDSCRNQHSVNISKIKLLKVSANDSCDGYLSDKMAEGTGINLYTQLITTGTITYGTGILTGITNTATFDGLTIDNTPYAPGSPILVTNTTAINNYLNGLGFGSFLVSYSIPNSTFVLTSYQSNGNVVEDVTITDGGTVVYLCSTLNTNTTTCEKLYVGMESTYINGVWIEVNSEYDGDYAADATNPLSYKLTVNNTVKIKGQTYDATPATTVTDELIFTLPAAYWPAQDQQFVCADSVQGIPCIIEVKTNGEVNLLATTQTATLGYGVSTTGVFINIAYDID